MNKDKAFYVSDEPIVMSKKKIKQPELIKREGNKSYYKHKLGKLEVTQIIEEKEFITLNSYMFVSDTE
jgi:hypothetical protein